MISAHAFAQVTVGLHSSPHNWQWSCLYIVFAELYIYSAAHSIHYKYTELYTAPNILNIINTMYNIQQHHSYFMLNDDNSVANTGSACGWCGTILIQCGTNTNTNTTQTQIQYRINTNTNTNTVWHIQYARRVGVHVVAFQNLHTMTKTYIAQALGMEERVNVLVRVI